MKPIIHSSISVSKFGGSPSDYQKIHDFMDMSKSAVADMRHRCLLHHSMGPYLAEAAFGITITNSEGKLVSVRDVAEQHIIDDLGCIPPFSKWTDEMQPKAWMGQPSVTKKTFTLKDINAGILKSTSVNNIYFD